MMKKRRIARLFLSFDMLASLAFVGDSEALGDIRVKWTLWLITVLKFSRISDSSMDSSVFARRLVQVWIQHNNTASNQTNQPHLSIPKTTDTTTMTNSKTLSDYQRDARIYEYGSAANPELPPIPVLVHPPELHESGATRVIPFDLSAHMEIPGEDNAGATSPNLMASFVRINADESIATQATATSQAFYVIRGSGTSVSDEHGTMEWSAGDMMVVPVTPGKITHTCASTSSDDDGSAGLYWIHDQPLLDYLGVAPSG